MGEIIELPEGYEPIDDNDEYMNDRHIDYFKRKLISRKEELLKKEQILSDLDNSHEADLSDMASKEYYTDNLLKNADRNRELIKEINEALKRIEEGIYGYCEATGDKIGIARLMANPITPYCIEEQEAREKYKKNYKPEI